MKKSELRNIIREEIIEIMESSFDYKKESSSLDFKKEINKKRKSGGWYQWTGNVDGKKIQLKGYKTWLQIYKIDGVDYGNAMDQSAKQFNDALMKPF